MTENSQVYDVLILGGGPAGYTAGLYAARAGLETLLLERLAAGGQMALSHRIDNYPGFPQGISGFDLAQKMELQARQFGLKVFQAEVQTADLSGSLKVLHTGARIFQGKTLILAGGCLPRALGLPGEAALTGRGVHYCAACDGFFYQGKTVVVAGGGNSAAGDALLLSRIAKKVILVHRRGHLRADSIYQVPLAAAENVEFCWNSEITGLLSDDAFAGICIRSTETGAQTEIVCDGLFVSIGRQPATQLLAGQLSLDAGGYIPAGEDTKTEIPGVFAAGDIRTKPLRQVVTAMADGAVAARMAGAYLDGR